MPKPDAGVLIVGATWCFGRWTTSAFTHNRKISERRGGLKLVQAMALNHGEGAAWKWPVICLIRASWEQIRYKLSRETRLRGWLQGGGRYFTDFSREKIVESY
ncbi:hypothetical protein ZIOFF_058806 [Zingiber officinale]|uniref:Uncharacterized protein n=1 Tax=Zingiber officinale TaxID=94328 RepID=A0A8J5KAZ3_ZINOF|nr:hypothetical protein ZIOFF_058806 [Zingiber officinale]